MIAIYNATLPSTTLAQASNNYINLTPLMVLVAVCASILFCCLCLTSCNSWMKTYHDNHQPAISYGEATQENLKFGSVFMTYMPDWMAERIQKSYAMNKESGAKSQVSSTFSNEREILLSLSRVQYYGSRQAARNTQYCNAEDGESSRDFGSDNSDSS